MPFLLLVMPLLKLIVRLKEPEAARQSERFHSIENEIHAAYGRAEFDHVVSLCHEYLELAEQNQDSFHWGNAVHNGNQYLGLVAIRREQIEEAKTYLLAAGRSVGSPQLNSHGPLMRLAHELLFRGERDVVIQYLNLVSKWWSSGPVFSPQEHRATLKKINRWKHEIRRGRVPMEAQWCGKSSKK